MAERAYALMLKNSENQKTSSSGGAFTAISEYFLEEGYAISCSSYNYETNRPEFSIITDRSGRDKARGSMYIQSYLGDIYKESENWLISNPQKNLLFVGMGCQAEGFRKYSELKGFADRVYTVDIICHGVPSPKLWSQYIEPYGRLRKLSFKDKRNGWSSPTAVAVTEDNREISISDYVKLFYCRCALRPSCHACKFATPYRKTDLTIGDFWGIKERFPDIYTEDGVSLAISHTEKGEFMLQHASKLADLNECAISECLQPNLEKPTEVSPERDRFWKEYKKHGFMYVFKRYTGQSKVYKIEKKIRKILNIK